MTLQDFLSMLEGVKKSTGNQYSALCPAHPDNNPSLSVSTGTGKDGTSRIILNCHAGCEKPAIMEALGLTMKDLVINPTPEQDFKKPQGKSKVVARYNYTDKDGNLLFQKTRWQQPDGGKTFSWGHKDASGKWVSGRTGDAVLYNLPVIAKTEHIFIVEGEKDVETLAAHGWNVAVSPPDGAKSDWKPAYTEALQGKEVTIIQDNDASGKAFAIRAANALQGAARQVRILDLTKEWPELQTCGDISDVLQQHPPEEVFQKLSALCLSTPDYTPQEEPQEVTAKELNDKFAPRLVKASDVPYTPPRWLLPPYFQRGKGTLIQADNGTGKTVFMCSIAAHISTGQPILGIQVETPGDVVVLSVEDDLPVLRGRIEADGGDLNKCHLIEHAAGLSLISPEIEEYVKTTHAKLLIFDPMQAFLGADVDMFRANETRPVLAKLFEMCDRNDCACAIISHEGKNTFGKSAVNRALGSVDIPAAMRSILQLIQDPNDPSLIIAVHVKCSNAPKGKSLSYRIGADGGLAWEGFSDITVNDLAVLEKRKAKEKIGVPYEREPLVQVFNQLITDKPGGGFWAYEEIKRRGMEIIGFPPFSTTNDLKTKLDEGLAKELQQKDGLIVTHSAKGTHGVRGIRIEQYRVPTNYQTQLD